MRTIVKHHIVMALVAALAAFGLCGRSEAQVLYQAESLLPSDGMTGDFFGKVSLSGDVALVGAPENFGNGSAYVFRWDGSDWVSYPKLMPADAAAGDRFGTSVALSGDVGVVGAAFHDQVDSNAGSAYVFRWDGASWAQETKLFASDGAAGDIFGTSVVLSGDVIVVGAPSHDGADTDSGAAYVFRWNGSSWEEEEKLLPSDGAFDDSFGFAVAVDGDVVIVGARWNDDNGVDSGAAYVFRWNGASWIEEQKLLPLGGAPGDEFGLSVALSGDAAVVGALADDDNGWSSGSAYVYRWNGAAWVHQQKLLPTDGSAGDSFGRAVTIFGDAIVVGAYGDDDNGAESGSAYLFRWNGAAWIQEKKLIDSKGMPGDVFGASVSLSGNVAAVGAPCEDKAGSSAGEVCIFNLSCDPGHFGPMCLECPGGASNPCTGQGTCDDGVGGTGVCSCNPAFSGADCAAHINECSQGSANCDANATCTNTYGSYSCTCNPGYSGDGVTCDSDAIPAASAWGLVILTLMLLAASKVYYSFRSENTAG